jgi:hypothetical protein
MLFIYSRIRKQESEKKMKKRSRPIHVYSLVVCTERDNGGCGKDEIITVKEKLGKQGRRQCLMRFVQSKSEADVELVNEPPEHQVSAFSLQDLGFVTSSRVSLEGDSNAGFERHHCQLNGGHLMPGCHPSPNRVRSVQAHHCSWQRGHSVAVLKSRLDLGPIRYLVL